LTRPSAEWSGFDHTNLIKHDPLLAAARGLPRLPDHATHNRFLTHFEAAGVQALEQAFWELFTRANQPAKGRVARVVLDFDATAACVYGKQEQAAFGHYNAKDGHRELSILTGFVGNSGDALGAELRAGNRHSLFGAQEFIAKVLGRLPAGMEAAWVRMDTGFFSLAVLGWLEKQPLEYTVGVPVTAELRQAAAGATWQRLSPEIELCEFNYTWKKDGVERRVLLTRQLDPKKTKAKQTAKGLQPALFAPDEDGCLPEGAYTYFALVTNNRTESPNALWQWYAGRAKLENCIKEAKLGFGLQRLPSAKFQANAAYLLLTLLAYNLVNWFKRELLTDEDAKRQVKGLRHRLLCVPALLKRDPGGRGWVIHLPQSHPSLPLFQEIRMALAGAPPG
jgi:hypothetical protein